MLFSSLFFLFAFLPIFLACYFLLPRKNTVALAGSIIFYAWGAPKFIFVLLAGCVVDQFIALRMEKSLALSSARKRYLITGLIFNLGLLLYFKYSNFFVDQLNAFLSIFGSSSFHWSRVLLPLGISFFTFQKISYLMDVYHGKVKPAESFLNYCLFVILFPQLIAGPIVKYQDLVNQFVRRMSLDQIAQGIQRFCYGLSKKVILANPCGMIADRMFGLPPDQLSLPYAWLGLISYTFQIYYDFSGYSDMAIGLGKMMGFEFPENFNRPYLSRNITEFWRRWHMTLSSFMREYLYVPLGGNRGSRLRTYFNLWIVFLLSGFWHGAEWTFVAWGFYHGMFLSIDKLFWLKVSERLPKVVCGCITLLIVMLGWVFFRADSIAHGFSYLASLFNFTFLAPSEESPLLAEMVSRRGAFTILAAAVVTFVPRAALKDLWSTYCGKLDGMFNVPFKYAVPLLLFALSAMVLTNSTFNPFIYFRF